MADQRLHHNSIENYVMFVIEGSTFFGNHYNEFKRNYIHPILEQMSGGPLSETQSVGKKAKFGVISFSYPVNTQESKVKLWTPFHTAHEVMAQIDQIPRLVTTGHPETTSPYIEKGLSEVIKTIQHLKESTDSAQGASKSSDSTKANNHIILMCNCEPFDILPPDCEWDTDGEDKRAKMLQICSQIKDNGIRLSIFAPRKTRAFRMLFDEAGGNSWPQINVPSNQNHLVLLNGFRLPERRIESLPKIAALPHKNASSSFQCSTVSSQQPKSLYQQTLQRNFQQQEQPMQDQQSQRPQQRQQNVIGQQQWQQTQRQEQKRQQNLLEQQQKQQTLTPKQQRLQNLIQQHHWQQTQRPGQRQQISLMGQQQWQQNQRPEQQRQQSLMEQQQRQQNQRPEQQRQQSLMEQQQRQQNQMPEQQRQKNPMLEQQRRQNQMSEQQRQQNQMLEQQRQQNQMPEQQRQQNQTPEQQTQQNQMLEQQRQQNQMLEQQRQQNQMLEQQRQQNQMVEQQRQQNQMLEQQRQQNQMQEQQSQMLEQRKQFEIPQKRRMMGDQQPQQQNSSFNQQYLPNFQEIHQPGLSTSQTQQNPVFLLNSHPSMADGQQNLPQNQGIQLHNRQFGPQLFSQSDPSASISSNCIPQPSTSNNGETFQQLWIGTLQWNQNETGPTARTANCSIIGRCKNGQPEVKADDWLPTMLMTQCSLSIFTNFAQAFLKNSKKLIFKFENSTDDNVLTKILKPNHVIFVRTQSKTNGPSSTIILQPKQGTLKHKAVIPNDEVGFRNYLKTIIEKHATRQAVLEQGCAPGSSRGPTAGLTLQQGVVPSQQTHTSTVTSFQQGIRGPVSNESGLPTTLPHQSEQGQFDNASAFIPQLITEPRNELLPPVPHSAPHSLLIRGNFEPIGPRGQQNTQSFQTQGFIRQMQTLQPRHHWSQDCPTLTNLLQKPETDPSQRDRNN